MRLCDILDQPTIPSEIAATLDANTLHLHFPDEDLFEYIINAFSWKLGTLAESLDCQSVSAHCPGYSLSYMHPQVLKELAINRLRERGVVR